MSTEYRVTTNGTLWRVEYLRPARFWRKAKWLPMQREDILFPFTRTPATFSSEQAALAAMKSMQEADLVKTREWKPIGQGIGCTRMDSCPLIPTEGCFGRYASECNMRIQIDARAKEIAEGLRRHAGGMT